MPSYHKYEVIISDKHLYIKNCIKHKILKIEREFLYASMICTFQELAEITNPITIPHEGIIGIIDILSYYYLIVITKSEFVGAIQKCPVFTIKEIDLIQISLNSPSNQDDFEIIRNHLKLLFNKGNFYYSFGFDLSRSLQTQIKNNNNGSYNENYCYDYMWNYELLKPFFSCHIFDNDFILPCIYGCARMFDSLSLQNSGQCLIDMMIIERYEKFSYTVSIKYLGLRGIYMENCALFKEVEFIFVVNDTNIFSVIYYESTVPVVYNDNSITHIHQEQFDRFMRKICNGNYKHIAMVSFFNEECSIKNKIELAYSNTPKEIKDNVKYFKNTSQNTPLFDSFLKYFGAFGKYQYNTNSTFYFTEQQGVFYFIKKNDDIYNVTANKMINTPFDLIQKYNLAYTQMFLDKLVMNVNISNQESKECILFLNKYIELNNEMKFHLKQPHFNIENLDIGLTQYSINYFLNKSPPKNEIITHKIATILVCTWNAGGIPSKPNYPYDLTPLFNSSNFVSQEQQSPDLIVVGLQEIVKLNATNILLNQNSSAVSDWRSAIFNSIKKAFPNEEYFLLERIDLVGILLLIYQKKSINVTICDKINIKSGAMGTMGNKGGCIISMNLYNTPIAFCCGHLAAGQNNGQERFKNIVEIFNTKLFGNQKTFEEIDGWFLFGDLNFRVDASYEEVEREIKCCNYGKIKEKDQFLSKRKVYPRFHIINEHEIDFPPTYKFEKGGDNYDNEGKNLRIPSWCDRILYKKSNLIWSKEYNSVSNIKYSDHKPVYDLFYINCEVSIKVGRDIMLYEMKKRMEEIK